MVGIENKTQQNNSKNGKKLKLWRRFKRWISRIWEKMYPRRRVRKGAAVGITIVIVLIVISFGIFITPGLPGFLDTLGGIVILLVLAGLIWLGIAVLLKLLAVFPLLFLTESNLNRQEATVLPEHFLYP